MTDPLRVSTFCRLGLRFLAFSVGRVEGINSHYAWTDFQG